MEISDSYITHLQLVQIAAKHLLTGKCKYEHVSFILALLNILPKILISS